MGASPEALPEASFSQRMTAGNLGALVSVTTCGIVGARAKACPAQPPNPTDAEPTVLHTCHHSTAACGYSTRNADLGTYQA
jgi:hypothetical protein